METKDSRREPIALVGCSLRFPGANSPSELWELLCHPRDILEDFPPTRMNMTNYYHPDGEHHGTTNVRKSYFISGDHRAFDATFFNITPMEAEAMDPQQRILLEVVYEAIEASGYTIEQLRGSQTSVFVGAMSSDFSTIQLRDGDTMLKHAATGVASSILSNRVSYFFDWKGPSMTIDTACSSSLVAVHQAVQSLRNGESQVAVVAGVNLILSPEPYIAGSKLHMLSPGARSKMWDIEADGYARGDGFAAIILKRMSHAQEDHDHIINIIRETMVNSDGRTTGITMPNASAQESLIRQTYQKAGLDSRNEADRCQYFEAHGTGTLVGDPIEAEAARNAFFPEPEEDGAGSRYKADEYLFIGSIKTVVGHLEGCAGLAGLLKASLAVQNGIIPPNLHFNTLNPKIQPFCAHLRVPIVAQPWPDIPSGSPRRASINSFGFGGTNAHAIVESYTPDTDKGSAKSKAAEASSAKFGGPFLFSANSESSLLARVKAFSNLLKVNTSIDLVDLSWVLQSRRTIFPVRTAFSGVTRERLIAAMDEQVQRYNDGSFRLGTTSPRMNSNTSRKILGIFTGQGAQWPQMGRELLFASKVFEQTINTLQRSLACLQHPPSWSLKAELIADPANSRIYEAAIAQPLCAAVQIALVELLKSAGLSFSAVVGHSSGEIAAAYAAGALSLSDAIRVAYYRGYHTASASSAGSRTGSMMVVSMSFIDALEFCQASRFSGRLCVAASNSPTSVTLSGDTDAIREARELLEQDYSTKLLRVDQAYHSHHMDRFIEPYIQSLRAFGVQPISTASSCVWISSVTKTPITDSKQLKDVYWADNMMQPVLFSHTIERAVRDAGPFNMMIEVGPHPTLEGPVAQTVKSLIGSTIPYCALLQRGHDSLETFSSALGYIWTYYGQEAQIDWDGYKRAFGVVENLPLKFLGDLPPYSWDHKRLYWKEPRISRNARFRSDPIHELLGHRRPDDSSQEMRWRNIIRLEEVPWLRGHVFQTQVVFPAAGYVTMALEASKFLQRDRQVAFTELYDVSILRALIIPDDSIGVEIIFALRFLEESQDAVVAEFVCSSCSNQANANLEVNSSGRIRLIFGKPSPDTLASRSLETRFMLSIDIDRFYRNLAELGLEYSGLFRALQKVERTTHKSTSFASWPRSDLNTTLTVHPAMLDVAFQSVFASIGSVASAWQSYLPTRIRRIRVNALPLESQLNENLDLIIDAYTTSISSPSLHSRPSICGDVDIATTEDLIQIQVEGLVLNQISESSPSKDRRLFYQTVWDVDILTGMAKDHEAQRGTYEETELPELLERLSHVYFRELYKKFSKSEIVTFKWYHQRLFEYMESVFMMIDGGRHPIIKEQWANDTREQVLVELSKFPETIDLRTANTVMDRFPAVLRGEITMLEVLTKDDMLYDLYNNALGLSRGYRHIARMAKQIAHRYPRLKVCEIGAGTGATTSRVLASIDGALSFYVYTDISSGFFEKAREQFKKYSNRMSFKMLNIEQDPAEQGFTAYSYDVVIASSVLHASRRLKDAVTNARRLLKPGGYLLLLEPTGESLRTSFVMGGLPGWWLGGDDGRRLGPSITTIQWDTLLQDTGFSGIDTLLHDIDDPSKHIYSSIASQALDDRIQILRQPLLSLELLPQVKQFIIIGGRTLQVLRLRKSICALLNSWEHFTLKFNDIESLDADLVTPAATILCLTELDRPAFESIGTKMLQNMQQLFSKAKEVLWVTRACRTDNPYSNMTVGLARVLLNEMPHLNLQLLDVSGRHDMTYNGQALTEILLRLLLRDTLNHDVLWSTEPELALEPDGLLLIPRLRPDKDLNDRLNSSWRIIRHEVSSAEFVIDICKMQESCTLYQGTRLAEMRTIPGGHVSIKVHLCLLWSVKILGATYLYICIGTIMGTEKRVIAISESNSSVIVVPSDCVFQCEGVPPGGENRYLQLVAAELIAENLFPVMPAGAVLLIHQPEATLANIIMQKAATADVEVVCTTTQLALCMGNPWIYLPPLASRRQIVSCLPEEVASFVDFSEESSNSVRSDIERSLPRSCRTQALADLFSHEPKVDVDYHVLGQKLAEAISSSKSRFLQNQQIDIFTEILASDLASGIIDQPHFMIVNWTGAENCLKTVKPLNPRDLLSADKTYMLVGMTGDLGISLGRWLIQNGARHLVLTSRRGVVNSQWLEEVRRVGANVKVYAMDITDKKALLSVYSELCATMPVIGGVVNGAMVLSDMLFTDMSLEALNTVVKPKVEGTKNLDDLFGTQDLDFFIMLSSVTAAAGYRGQSNYAAANMFMAGLASQRRHKGLTASVIDVGMLTEIGYVSRAGRALEDYLRRKNHCLPISEPEFHHIFAEAIAAGRPEAGHQPEIITGLQGAPQSLDIDRPPWLSNPRFSHCVLEEDDIDAQEGGTSVLQISQSLAGAGSREKAIEILQDAFIFKLGKMLQLSRERIHEGDTLMHLGVDSLIAIEISSWFLKEAKVDVPILKVLSSSTIAELCEEAVGKFLSSLQEKSEDIKTPETSKQCYTPTSTEASARERLKMSTLDIAPTPDLQNEVIVNEKSVLVKSQLENHSTESLSWSPDRKYPMESLPAVSLSHGRGEHRYLDGIAPEIEFAISPDNNRLTAMPSEIQTRGFTMEEKSQALTFGGAEQMSYAQSRLWFLTIYSENPTSYNITLSYDIKGPLDVPRFVNAFQRVTSRHQIFRTQFFTQHETGEGMQRILEEAPVLLEKREIANDADVQKEFDRIKNNVFTLDTGNAFLATLLCRSPTWSTIIFGYHHILMDGSSFFLFLQELSQAYHSRHSKPPANQYFDFALSQRLKVKSGELVGESLFWNEEFSTLPSPIPLFEFSRVRSRSAINEWGIHTVHAEVPHHQAMRIKSVSQKLQLTPFHFHLAALQSLLFKFLAVDEVCIGIADANRTDPRFLETIGVFLNLLPLRFQRDRSRQFADIAKYTSQKVLAALANSRLPFEVLLDELNVPRDPSHTPLFQILVNYRTGALHKFNLGDCEMRHREINDATLPYDMTITITEPAKESCFISIAGRDNLYSKEACNMLLKSYVHLLDQVSENPLQIVDEYNLYKGLDARLAIDLGRGVKNPSRFQLPLSRQVEAITQSNGNDIAVKDGYGSTLTYCQLVKRSQDIAGQLSAAGVRIGSYVAVLMEPSNDSIASLLAILRLGAIYTPLDLRNAVPRLAAITQDCRPSIVICQENTLGVASSLGLTPSALLNLSSPAKTESAPPKDFSELHLPAFALYTSGSTGTPKGILITQANLLNSINGTLDDQCTAWKEVILQQSSMGFDLSLYQIFRGLVPGGTLIVAHKTVRGDGERLAELILAENVTFTLATPSEYSILLCYGEHHLKKCSSWKLAYSCGENLTSHLQEGFRRLKLTNLALVNCFGPTELGAFFTTAHVSYTNASSSMANEYPLIGKPIPNVSVYILDENLTPVPTGFPGELCVAGASNSLGYINDQELNQMKFLENPFTATEETAFGRDRLYRTGDRGRILDDGSIVFLGRIAGDSQIKLRGYRIELEDVANTILHAAGGTLSDAAVTVRGEPQSLVAFVVFSQNSAPRDSTRFLKKLSSELPLPSYMSPSMIVPVNHLPTTANGKRDRAALSSIHIPTSPAFQQEIYLSDTESSLKNLWTAVLPSIIDVVQINRDTSFFYAGGNSILIMKLRALIMERFDVRVTLAELFQSNALGSMAARIEAKRNDREDTTVDDLSGSYHVSELEKVGGIEIELGGNNEIPINWEDETAVLDIAPIPEEHLELFRAPRKGMVILLTGSTDFFGRAILRKLVENTMITKVHCIAVPKADEFHPTNNTPDYIKVETHVGNVLSPDLGLSDTEIELLSQEVDVIVHAGVNGSFLNSYQSLRQRSVGFTKQLVRIATPLRIPIHFVSSSRVVLFAGVTSLEEISVSRFHPPTDGSDGLTSAKWACERYLENVVQKMGLPVCIHRSCAAFSENAPPTDVLNAILKYSGLLKAVPILEKAGGYIDYAPVETIADEIVCEVFGKFSTRSSKKNLLSFVHHASGHKVTPRELKTHFEDQEGCFIEELPLTEWVHRAKQLGISEFVTAALDALQSRKDLVYFPLLLKTRN
ncbi:hypothetical protein F4679DRAFT_35052 [Xylaria curta]|nr:hypothetical protein F4679DRAFT_35052 [Xylaria curta]